MRASPAFQVVIDRFGVWRSAVILSALAGVLVIAGWLASQSTTMSATARWLTGFLAFALLSWGCSAAQVRAASLRWDGQLWRLGAPSSAGHEPRVGKLRVMLDLGPWMLLRFEPAESTWRTRAIWLPVQRRGLETQWHALRCAVYSPRPKPGTDSVADV
jgi:hypothetical protein